MNLKRSILLVGILFLLSPILAIAQLTITLSSIPANTPANDNIYVAGDFNSWDPGSANHILTLQNGKYQIELDLAIGTYEFKFTRGSWDTVEGNASGGFQPNHSVEYNGGTQSIELPILSWEGQGGGMGTAAANVHILDDAFFIPQLNRTRRIWLYLPPDYATSNKRYPVLYMHDAQNLFDDATSFSGEWHVDESLNELFEQGDYGVIVIGIENGGSHRLDEYSPWTTVLQGQTYGGEGDEYVEFIVNTLRPYVDANYRTLTGPLNTGIMGSSMGGLISHYAIMEHQDVFGRAGIFSPSYWFSDEVFTHTASQGDQNFPSRFYTIAGEQEGGEMIEGVQEMEGQLLDAGFKDTQMRLLIHPDGTHSEWYWDREFPAAYQWLFRDMILNESSPLKQQNIRLSPNPTQHHLLLEMEQLPLAAIVEIYNLEGKLVQRIKLQQLRQDLDIHSLTDSLYTLRIMVEGQLWWSKRFVVQH